MKKLIYKLIIKFIELILNEKFYEWINEKKNLRKNSMKV